MAGEVPTQLIRPERPADVAAVHALNAAAFGRAVEAEAVDAVRADGAARISLVAELAGEVVGHVMFSPVTLDGAASPLLGLAPLAVAPAHQRRGIGGRLVEAGLAACRAAGAPGVVLAGHTDYYPRFGFVPAPPRGLQLRGYPDCEAFFVIELAPGALAGLAGEIAFHPAFDGA